MLRSSQERHVAPGVTFACSQQDQPKVGFTAYLTESTEGIQSSQISLLKAYILTCCGNSPSRTDGEMIETPITILVCRDIKSVAVVSKRYALRRLAAEDY
jgi:hypothetical protein